jgi:hypothetical protein
VDRYQSSTYQVIGWSFTNGQLQAYFGDGSIHPSVYATLAELYADPLARPVEVSSRADIAA